MAGIEGVDCTSYGVLNRAAHVAPSLFFIIMIRCAIGYKDNNPKNPLIVLDSGNDVDEFSTLCQDDNIIYGLVRVVSHTHSLVSMGAY